MVLLIKMENREGRTGLEKITSPVVDILGIIWSRFDSTMFAFLPPGLYRTPLLG